jgi:alkylation response protein AidB-like acyl-CoA dehydrogenase
MLEACSYQSLPLSLAFGINGALFLQPLARYGTESAKERTFRDFVDNAKLGGLMITEPEFGTDALSMQSSFEKVESGYRLSGTKHWGGLTGKADYWLVTARGKEEMGLSRDIDFFVVDTSKPEQQIIVEELYPNAGLLLIPYGLNTLNINIPEDGRLTPKSTGIRMMLDTLHRSRSQFPGMAMGFLRRIVDEALQHTKERNVGGSSLFNYDQIKRRIAAMQAYSTTCSAMCTFTSENNGLDVDMATSSLTSNSIKAVVTDFMQDASQSLLQMMGAKGYRLDAVAGRAIVDSRPFQIFEGSNDILYQQISESVLKSMRKLKEKNLYTFLSNFEFTNKAATYFKSLMSFEVDMQLPQRKLVDMGRALGRVISLEFVIELGERGFHSELIANTVMVLREEIETIISRMKADLGVGVVEDLEGAAWLKHFSPQV